MAERRCSECTRSLEDRAPTAKTCSTKCRKARSERMKKTNDLAEAHDAEITPVTRRRAIRAAHEATVQELRPIIREALTEEALGGIKDLLGLMPAAVATLIGDLASDDAVLRQRAAALVVKYTMGNPALVQHEDTAGGGQIVVNFALPRPGEPVDQVGSTPNDEGAWDGEGDELRSCSSCGTDKPVSEFVEESDRCKVCHEELRAKVLGRVGDAG